MILVQYFIQKRIFFYVERDENDVIAVSGLIHILLNQRDLHILNSAVHLV